MLKSILKFMLASTLIVSGLIVGGTIFAGKGIDELGDDLEDKIHG